MFASGCSAGVSVFDFSCFFRTPFFDDELRMPMLLKCTVSPLGTISLTRKSVYLCGELELLYGTCVSRHFYLCLKTPEKPRISSLT